MAHHYLYLITVAVVVYVSWRLLKLLFHYFREYFVLWAIVRGGGRKGAAMDRKVRLYVFMTETEYLDEVSVNELYTFLLKMLDAKDASIKDFHSLLRTYTYAVICRDRTDGSLRGVGLAGIDRRDLNGYKYTTIRVGLSFFQNYYQGGPILYYMIAYLLLKELILHPLTPLYTVGKAFTYKSYMLNCHAFPYGYPRYDKETPQFAKEIINEFARSIMTPSEEYDEDTFVLKRERSHVKTGVVEVSDKDLENPHIKFFVERNPGWTKGHQLIVLGQVRWIDILGIVWKSLVRSRPGANRPKKKKLLTRLHSYQNDEFRRYSTVYSEIDGSGERVDHVAENRVRLYSDDLYCYDQEN